MTENKVRTSLRVDFDAVESSQLDSVHRTIHWLDEMRNAGWNVRLTGHLTAELGKPTVSGDGAAERAASSAGARPSAGTGAP